MSVIKMEAKRATYEQLDQYLIASLEEAQGFIEAGIDIAHVTDDLDPADETDGLVKMRRTLLEATKRLKYLSPYLEG